MSRSGVAALVTAAVLATTTACSAADAGEQPPADSAETVATVFWDFALAEQCIRAAAQTWWPVAVEDRRNDYVGTCERQAGKIESVEVGKARPSEATVVPYGVTDVVTVPVRLALTDGTEAEQDLTLVEVKGRWFVTR